MARKKHSAKRGVRGRKVHCASPGAARRAEIIEEIVDHLRPWKQRMSEATVRAGVNRALKTLLPDSPSEKEVQRGFHKAYRTYAKQLDSALSEVETLLASAPGRLASSLFYPVLVPMTMASGGLSSPWEIGRANETRNGSFAAELRRLRSVCAQALNPDFERHPNFDFQKYFCARSSYDLMQAKSDRKIAGTKDGAFRAIASLLYEAVSGQQGADLKRACDSVLREIRGPK